MYQFFKSMHSVANLSEKNYSSIKELVTDIATSAGYYTEMDKFGHKDVLKTRYSKKWDDILVAKWYCYYEMAFTKIFIKHPEFRNDFVDFILTRTFHSFFSALKLDKLSSDAGVNSLFNITLANRVGEAIFLIGSPTKLAVEIKTKEDNDRFLAETGSKVKFSKRKCQKNVAINYNTISLNMLFDGGENKTATSKYGKFKEPSVTDLDSNEMIVDLKRKLKDNEYGELVLKSLLYSDKKFKVHKLADFINMNKSDMSEEAMGKIKDAYMTVVNYLYNSLEDGSQLKEDLKKQYIIINRESFLRKFSYGNEVSL